MFIKKIKKIISSLFVSIGVIISSCTTMSTTNPDVFDNPKSYLGQKIIACGKAIDGANIVQISNDERDQSSKGFVLTGNRSLADRKKRGNLCVKGLVVFIGCNTDEVVCMDAAYDYGIEIQ